MKSLILLSFMLVLGASSPSASEFQSLEGQAAYELYQSLPGVRCLEWNSSELVVYTKYQTESCDQNSANDQWTCTIQVSKIDLSKKFLSASCSREVL